jgi:hypothetical protein
LRNNEGLAATLFVWPLIGNALLNFRQRTIMTRYCNEALSAHPLSTAFGAGS